MPSHYQATAVTTVLRETRIRMDKTKFPLQSSLSEHQHHHHRHHQLLRKETPEMEESHSLSSCSFEMNSDRSRTTTSITPPASSSASSEKRHSSSLKVPTQAESLALEYASEQPINERSSTTSGSARRRCKSVGFSEVTVHYHEATLGQHLCVPSGPPVALSNRVVHHERFDSLDEFEASRQQPDDDNSQSASAPMALSASLTSSTTTSSFSEPRRLSASERIMRLIDSGISVTDIESHIRKLDYERKVIEKEAAVAAIVAAAHSAPETTTTTTSKKTKGLRRLKFWKRPNKNRNLQWL